MILLFSIEGDVERSWQYEIWTRTAGSAIAYAYAPPFTHEAARESVWGSVDAGEQKVVSVGFGGMGAYAFGYGQAYDVKVCIRESERDICEETNVTMPSSISGPIQPQGLWFAIAFHKETGVSQSSSYIGWQYHDFYDCVRRDYREYRTSEAAIHSCADLHGRAGRFQHTEDAHWDITIVYIDG